MEQQDLNKRLLLALALSFFVFVGYSYLFPPQQAVESTEQTKVSKHQTPTASVTPTAINSTPATTENKNNAPVSTSSMALLATISSNTFKMSIDEFGRIAQYELLEEKYKDDEGKNLKILGTQEVKPLEVRFSDVKLNEEAFKIPYTNNSESTVDIRTTAKTIILTQKLSTVTITKKITVQTNGAYEIDVSTSSATPYFITPGHRPMADTSMYMLVRGALVKGPDDVIITVEDGKAEGNENIKNAKIASAFDRYVASMFYSFDKGMNVTILKEKEDNPLIFIEGNQNLHLGGYIGPKEYNTLNSINSELSDTIEFGFFTFLSKPFYKVILWINDYCR